MTTKTTTSRREATINTLASKLAKEHAFIDTLEEQGRDSLDFHDVSVGAIKAMIEAAYKAGMEAAKKA